MVELTSCNLNILELNSGLDNGGIDIMQFKYPWVEHGLDNGGIDTMQLHF